MIKVITHRGLDPDLKNYFRESSFQSFLNQIDRGYGLEFDLQITSDEDIVVCHDLGLGSISAGVDQRLLKNLTAEKITSLNFGGNRLCRLEELLLSISMGVNKDTVNAIHLKGFLQQEKYLEIILDQLKNIDFKRFIIFDVTVDTARWLKAREPRLLLAPSVSHKYDIERYNNVTGGTLLSVNEVLNNRNVFDWVWLDEWGTEDKDGHQKIFYTKELFELLRSEGFKIGLVTPELHSTSPGLLAGESHKDARDIDTLLSRIKEISALEPDIMCTDHPDAVRELIS